MTDSTTESTERGAEQKSRKRTTEEFIEEGREVRKRAFNAYRILAMETESFYPLGHCVDTLEYALDRLAAADRENARLREESTQIQLGASAINTAAMVLTEENKRLRAREARLVTALELAGKAMTDILSFYGRGLDVHGWHQNGDAEPWDDFFEENGFIEASNTVESALADCPPAASAPDAIGDVTLDLIAAVEQWKLRTFGDTQPAGQVDKIAEEMRELFANPGDAMEQADVIITMIGVPPLERWIVALLESIPGLADAVAAKHEVNKLRTWRQDASGVWAHVKEVANG